MSKNNIQQTEWNKVDYYYGIGTLIDGNHLDYREKGYGAHLHVSVIRLPKGTELIGNKGVITVNNKFLTWGDPNTPKQQIWKNMINPFNYEDSNTWQGRYK